MKKIKKIIIISIMIMILMINHISVMAANVVEVQQKNYRFTEDIVQKGTFGDYSFFFYVEEGTKIKSTYLNLVFTPSNILDKDNSNFTIYLNGIPVYSLKLISSNSLKRTVKIALPKDKIKDGYNNVGIRTYKRVGEKPCTDDLNNGNWVVFHKESYVHIDFQDKNDKVGLSDFPYPYMKFSDNAPANGIIVIPDDFDDSEITAAMMLCSNFGAKNKYLDLTSKVYKFSDIKDFKSNNLIFIGKVSSYPKEIAKLLTNSERNSAKENAVIKESPSPYNKDKKILTILCDKKDKILKASKLLSSKDFVSQIKSNSIIVDDATKIEDLEYERKEKIYFSDLGYDNIILQGKFRQETSLTINTSKNKMLKNNSKIVLKTRYSKNLDFDKSLMTVFLNGIPIGSRKLDPLKADNDTFEMMIPEELRNSSSYDVKIAFDLDLKEVYCNIREEANPFAYISKDSYVYFSYSKEKDVLFENYPNIFLEDGSYKDLILVLPDKADSKDINIMGDIMTFIGHDLENNRGNINVIKANEFNPDKHKGNIIVVGTPESSSFIKKVNDKLNVKFNKEYNSFVSNNKVNILKEYSKEIATIQLIESPYHEENHILVFTAIDSDNLRQSSKYLKNSNLVSKLKGDTVIVNKEGEIQCITIKDKNQSREKNIFNFDKLTGMSKELIYLIVFASLAMIALLLIIVLFMKKHRKNKH
ncbi:cellulose biosynthesis cyclic di-GMP-binding regulatory protein BcsB [Haloimpatiens sp. FM7315]|uniref:cellulose biosynthesis cyclic di-GMP-binding regulatory protein BcsB n=1 Tax=Haloimpatiens sp. FM7315 TaxID=3298609 RepID=UPI003709EAE8